MSLNPNFLPTIINAAENLVQCKRLPEAIGYYKKALRLDQDNFTILICMGRALLAAGQFLEAIATFQKLKLVAPDSPDSRILSCDVHLIPAIYERLIEQL